MDCLRIVLRWLQRFSLCLALLYAAFLVLILLYPYNFADPLVTNGVGFNTSQGIIRFPSKSMLRSEEPLAKFYQAMVTGGGLSVVFIARPYTLHQRGPARIISYSKNPWQRNFTVGQYGSALSIRIRTPTAGLNGTKPEVFVPGVFTANKQHHIVISYDFKALKVYVDGALRHHRLGLSGNFANWETNFALVLGNELTGGQPWLGELRSVSIYNRPLSPSEIKLTYEDYLYGLVAQVDPPDAIADFRVSKDTAQDGSITSRVDYIPIQLTAPARIGSERVNFLREPYDSLRSHFLYAPKATLFDIIANIVLFVPLGVLLYLFLRRHTAVKQSLFWATLLGGVLTLGVESLQYFLTSRYSSMLDVIDNTLGVLAGSVLACYLLINQALKSPPAIDHTAGIEDSVMK